MAIPTHLDLLDPVLQALKRLGGSASIVELDAEEIPTLKLTPQELEQRQPNDKRLLVPYRMAWARTYLKYAGLLDTSARGVWTLTERGASTDRVDLEAVKQAVRGIPKRPPKTEKKTEPTIPTPLVEPNGATESGSDAWQAKLLDAVQSLSPAAFERLCQRLLRESGFLRVQVTGRSGDGGIDGIGLVQIGGLISFPIVFQCKRYKGTVGAPAYRRSVVRCRDARTVGS